MICDNDLPGGAGADGGSSPRDSVSGHLADLPALSPQSVRRYQAPSGTAGTRVAAGTPNLIAIVMVLLLRAGNVRAPILS